MTAIPTRLGDGVDVPVPTARVDDHTAELRHEAQAALLGIEGAASALARHRTLSTVQIDELSFGLVAEVRRLRALLDQRSLRSATFDLLGAIAPVLTCARARGLDVRSSVGPGISVLGKAESTAQALVALLTNAQRHAPGSPIDVRASTAGDAVMLHVEDRGPGIPHSHQERIFHRSVQVVGGEGSGLGLFIARQLMEGQDGTISVEARAGGGSSFVLRFDVPSRHQPLEPRLGEAAPEPVLVGA